MDTLIGQKVWTTYGDLSLLFGTVREEKTEGGWKYVKVDWINDETRQKYNNWKADLRNEGLNPEYDWFKWSSIRKLDVDSMISDLQKV